MHLIRTSRIRHKRAAILAAASLATITCAGFLATAANASPPAASTLVSLSGSITDGRAEQVSAGVITAPASTPSVQGAQIEVNGREVAASGASGAFSFSYPDTDGGAVTVTVSASGFGSYQLKDVTPSHSGDTLTVQLTSAAQSIDAQAEPGQAPANRAQIQTPAATSSCGGYFSNTTPPSAIRVLEYSEHTGSGAPVAGTETGVFSVPFETYAEDVLPNEWISSWDAASLDAGAMAVKTYSWYWVNHWRGGSYNGACYNVDDSIDYQRYIPGQSAGSTNKAVAATWGSVMTEGGAIFQASFQATLTGSASEACGTGLADFPNTLSQWGSQNCAAAGDPWQTIIRTYYPGAAIGGGRPAVSMDAAGSDVAFVNASGQVVHDWGTSTGWKGPAAIGGTARSDSPVAIDAAGTGVMFVNASGQVVNDWATSTGWKGPAGIGGTARAGSALAMNAAGTDVSFVNASGQVVHDWHTSTGWHGPAALGGTARADSPLAENNAGNHVFFINSSGQVVNDWAVPATGWHGPAAIGGTAKADSPLAINAAGTGVVFVNTAGQVVNDWAVSTSWKGPAGIGGTAEAGSGITDSAGGTGVVFVNTAGQVVNDWGTSTGWKGPAGIGGTAEPGSVLATDTAGTDVVFVNTAGQVVNDWGTSTGWKGPAAIGGTSR